MQHDSERPDLVILSGGMWDERWTTFQRVAGQLRPHFRILYVEGNYSWGKIARAVARPGAFPIVPFGRLVKVDEGFHVLTPTPRLFLRHYLRPIGVLNQWMLARHVRRAARHLGMRRPIVWSFLHQSDRVMGTLDECLSVYHCVDHWSWLISKVPLMGSAQRVAADEARTAARADFTVSTSQFLRDRLSPHNPRSHYVPNAANVDHFSVHAETDPPAPPDLAALPRPILGFSGTLEVKTDLALLRRLAREHPEWTQVYIGHAEGVRDIHLLRGLPNVHFLGLKSLADMPLYLRHFDVCLVPFRRTPELESISPLKIFEYLAAGRPIVATRYAEIERFGGVVELCDSPDDFAPAIERALARDRTEDRRQRLQVARENSWEVRGAALRGLLTDALQGRRIQADSSSSRSTWPT